MEAHPRGPTPHDHVTMLEQDSARRVSALEPTEQEDALQPERYRNDWCEQVELRTILVNSELRSCLIAIDVARIRPKLRETSSHRTSDREIRQHPRYGRPNPLVRGCLWRWGRNRLRIGKLLTARVNLLPRIPSPSERFWSAAVRDHHLHRQAARGCCMAQRRRRKHSFYRRKKLDILLQCQSSHEDRARVDLLMRRLRRKLGKEIHRTHGCILPQKRIKNEDSFPQLRFVRIDSFSSSRTSSSEVASKFR